MRVLLVDPDPATADAVGPMLLRLGYELAGTATSLDEAVRLAQSADAALVDVSLVAPATGAAPAGSRLPHGFVPVLYTVAEDDARLARVRASHPGAYVLKPIAERELRWALTALLGEGRAGGDDGAFVDDFFDLSVDMLCCLGFDGYFARLNPAWERVLGFSREELMSRPFIEFVHPDDRERTLRQNREVRNGGHAHGFENRYLCKDGSYRWLLWNAAPNPARKAIYSVARDVTERRRTEEALERLSTTDELTGLWNRRGLAALADRELERAIRRSACALLFYIDLDRFKEINDAFGHAAGDRVLEDVARLLRESCRGSDVVARVGGDEFVVLALDENGEGERIITERILQAVRRLNEAQRHPCEVALTMGSVSLRPGETADLQALLTRADERMYHDKRRKRRLRAG